MKSSLLKALFATLLALGVGLPSAQAATVKAGEAVAVSVQGAAEFSLNGKDWTPLRVNDVLKPGAEVRTATGAIVDLFLNYNGPVVSLRESSHLGITKLDREDRGDQIVTDTRLDLKSGSVMGYAQKLGAGSRYEIKTPTSVANITGTLYYVYASGAVYVQSGTVDVSYSPKGNARYNDPVQVTAGFYFDPVLLVVSPTPPVVGDTLIAAINTSVGNVRTFNLSRGRKLTVKAISN